MSSILILLFGLMFSDVTDGINPQAQVVWNIEAPRYIEAEVRGLAQGFNKGDAQYTLGGEATVALNLTDLIWGKGWRLNKGGVLIGGGWEGARLFGGPFDKSTSRWVGVFGFRAGPTTLLGRYLWPDEHGTRGIEGRLKVDFPSDHFVIEAELGEYSCDMVERDRRGQLLHCGTFSATAIRFGWRF